MNTIQLRWSVNYAHIWRACYQQNKIFTNKILDCKLFPGIKIKLLSWCRNVTFQSSSKIIQYCDVIKYILARAKCSSHVQSYAILLTLDIKATVDGKISTPSEFMGLFVYNTALIGVFKNVWKVMFGKWSIIMPEFLLWVPKWSPDQRELEGGRNRFLYWNDMEILWLHQTRFILPARPTKVKTAVHTSPPLLAVTYWVIHAQYFALINYNLKLQS